ncbi:NAD+ synthase [Patescibacteria group bacterium]|nr:NAD+ synthase [Patescibacteria group bacterium]
MQDAIISQEVEKIITFIKISFQKAGFSHAVLAVSGGVDSAVSLALAVNALGEENVYPILLPYGILNTQGVLDAMELITQLHIPLTHVVRIDITKAVDDICGKEMGMDNVRKGNIIARARMIYLFDQAKKRNALVIGTENKSEHLLGYFTRFGDSASDIEPIGHLYKTQVVELASYLKVPQKIVEKPPTAGLWPEQTDEGELGFSYKDADQILSLLYDERKTVDEIVALGFDKELIEKIQTRVSKNSFKHTTPYRL